jgi:hydrogenase maturation factor
MVVGGHSEYTAGLDRPIISMTAAGITTREDYVSSGGARPGDLVLMTKTAAVEGTAILASDFKDELLAKGASNEVIERARSFIKNISVLKEALILAERRLATSMHDPTEGGIIGGLTEIAYASKVSIDVWEDKIPVAEETRILCGLLGVDYLRAVSSGVLIATVPRELGEEAISQLRKIGIPAALIGEVASYGGYLVKLHRADGSTETYREVQVMDEIIKLWEGRSM